MASPGTAKETEKGEKIRIAKMTCIPDERNKNQAYFDEIENRRKGASLP
jgi:hypothetical protein